MDLRQLVEPFLGPVSTATIVFPVAASVIAVPFALFHYRRHGHVHPWRAFLSYSFVYYLIAALFLVVLPLPERPVGAQEVAAWHQRYAELTTPRLDPTGFVKDLLAAADGAESNRALAQIVFNVLLLAPFGLWLVYVFRRPLAVVPLFGLVLSLFFEICQLTGDFGLYPGPYRLFDTGDLVLNTTGTLLGGLAARLLMRLGALPRLEDLKGPVDPWIGPFRRALALLLDACAFGLTALAAAVVADLAAPDLDWLKNALAATLALAWFVLLPVVDRGRSLGKRLCFCAIRRADGNPAAPGRILARQAFLWAPPVLAWVLLSTVPALRSSVALVAGVAVWLGLFAVNALKATFGHEHAGYVDLWLRTRVRDTWTDVRAPRPRSGARKGRKAAPRARPKG